MRRLSLRACMSDEVLLHQTPPSTASRRWWQRIPMIRVIVLTIAMLLMGEQFPFSYFPMYSSFDPQTDYYFVTSEEGKPLACVETFGTSTANVKKMYRSRLRELVAAHGVGETDATPQERERVGEEMLVYLRGLGLRLGKSVPNDPVLLKRVVLKRSNGGEISQHETVVAQK